MWQSGQRKWLWKWIVKIFQTTLCFCYTSWEFLHHCTINAAISIVRRMWGIKSKRWFGQCRKLSIGLNSVLTKDWNNIRCGQLKWATLMVKGLHITQATFCPKTIIKVLSICTHLHVCQKNITTTTCQSWNQCSITNGCNTKNICSESPQILVTMQHTVTALQ